MVSRIDRLWVPSQNPHHSIIGLTGSGKSYLVTRGLLNLVPFDNVCILDVKGDDPTLAGVGRTVRAIPTWTRTARQLIARDEPRENWYRLIVHDDPMAAREQLNTAFARMWKEKNWIIVVDELRALLDTIPRGGLHMGGWWNRIMMRGRSKGICVINCTQEPAWVPSLFYTQPSFLWIGQVEDERAHKRITEIGSSRAMLAHLPNIRKRNWLYTDNLEDFRHFALTTVGAVR